MKKQIIKNQQPAGVFELRYGQDRKKSTPIVIETPLKSRRDNTPVSQNLPIIEVETKTLDQILPSFQSKKEIKKGTDKNSIRAEQQALWDAEAFKGIKNKYGKELSYKEAVDGPEGKLTRQARANYQSTSRDWIPVGRNKETLREEQEALQNAGAFKGLKNKFGREVSYKEAVDGIEGSMTRQARENYRETVDTKLPADPMGYIPVRERRKIEENAKARKEGIAKQRELAPRREFTVDLNKSNKVVPIEIMDPLDAYVATTKVPESSIIVSNTNSKSIVPISLKQAKELYQNGAGILDIGASAFFHGAVPQSVSMPHSNKVKDQIAAAIAYTENNPNKIIEDNGLTFIGYDTYGKLADQPENINDQGNTNNATAKVMGGLRYKINEDGSVDVLDNYAFNTTRDFTRTNSHGKPYVYKKGDDPYESKQWQGLWHDLTTEGNGKSLQNLAENFLTRQGKVRRNNIHFTPGEINRRNQEK